MEIITITSKGTYIARKTIHRFLFGDYQPMRQWAFFKYKVKNTNRG